MTQKKAMNTTEKTQEDGRFVFRLALSPTEAQKHELRKRFVQVVKWYNVNLREAIKRVEHIKANKRYQWLCTERRRLNKKLPTDLAAELKSLSKNIPGLPFKGINIFDVTKELKYKNLRNAIAPDLGAQPANTIAERAYETAGAWLYGGERPRFRSLRRGEWVSINGNQHIKLTPEGIQWGAGLIIKPYWEKGDEFAEYALKHRISSIEMCYNGDTFSARLICVGKTLSRVQPKSGSVGVDIGVSTVAVVDATSGSLVLRHDTVQQNKFDVKLRKISRKMSRQIEANKKNKLKQDTAALKATKKALRKLHRKEATARKNGRNILAKDIAARGIIMTEDLDFRSWRNSNWNKRLKSTAPGYLIARLKQLTNVVLIPTRTTALSQMCLCGRKAKNPNMGPQARHICDCGVNCQRDIFSAYLARFVVEGEGKGKLDLQAARNEWLKGAHTTLSAVGPELYPSGKSASKARGSVVTAPLDPLADKNSRERAYLTIEEPLGRKPTVGVTRGRSQDERIHQEYQATTRPKHIGPRSS
jgi:transposase